MTKGGWLPKKQRPQVRLGAAEAGAALTELGIKLRDRTKVDWGQPTPRLLSTKADMRLYPHVILMKRSLKFCTVAPPAQKRPICPQFAQPEALSACRSSKSDGQRAHSSPHGRLPTRRGSPQCIILQSGTRERPYNFQVRSYRLRPVRVRRQELRR